MTSTDLVNWAPRRPYDKDELDPALVRSSPHAGWMFGDEWFNDALLQPAKWGGDFSSGRMSKELWAPGVARIGSTYAAYYAVRLPTSQAPAGERFCLSVATATSPIGPFYDRSETWLHCDSDPKGSIDPEPFLDSNGTPYLLWKSEGRVGVHPPRVYVQQLERSGTAFARGSSPTLLLTQDQGWEGNVVENPSMVRHDGQLYLFYSGNEWDSSDYATSYATCASVTGPCTKARSAPLLQSSPAMSKIGPGGASAFLDASGAMRLAYHHWARTEYVGYPADQRKMSITTVSGSGTQLVVGPDAPAGPRPVPTPTVRTIDDACPARVPGNAFADDDGNAHERAIDCLAWWTVTAGRDGRYNPSGDVTREQMATFLANAIERSGTNLPDTGRDFFTDDETSPHERNINRLAAVGVVSAARTRRTPRGALVTRAQMATFLVRAVKQATGTQLTSTTDWFVDDGASGSHQSNINAAASAGLAGGTGPGAYSPDRTGAP
jgi:GH43 family beta-xylosidase